MSKIYELDNNYEVISKYFVDKSYLNWLSKSYEKAIEIKDIWLKNSNTSPEIVEYVSSNLFRPFRIKLGEGVHTIDEIKEITIMGHSLNSDIDIIEDLLHSCLNLKKVNIFYFTDESIDERIKKINFVIKNVFHSSIDVALINYWTK